jgi:hypothetical protein
MPGVQAPAPAPARARPHEHPRRAIGVVLVPPKLVSFAHGSIVAAWFRVSSGGLREARA